MTVPSLTAAGALLVRLTDETPQPEDVKAGWTALVVFLLLIAAVVVLAFSLVKQLRKAQAAEDAGVYGHDPEDATDEPAADDAAADETAAPAQPAPGRDTDGSGPGPRPTP